jgi:hypothetical protein
MVAGSISLGFAVVLFGAGFVRSLVKSRASKARVAPMAPVGAVMRGSAAALREVRKEVSRDGWTPERVAQALSALRVAAAVTLGRPVAQIPVEPDVPAREGQVLVRSGFLRPLRMAVSAPTGTRAVESPSVRPGKPPARWKRLDLIGDSLRVFNRARYSRNDALDAAALDAALEQAEQALSRLWIRYSWPARSNGRLVKSAATGGPAWFR